MTTSISRVPGNTPAEVLQISPEGLEIANSYLQHQDIQKVSQDLNLPPDIVAQHLSRREIKAYIDNVFMDIGFNNQFKLRSAMDALIQQKFQELDEAGVGSGKDIADLIALSHKITMEQMDKQIQLEKIRHENVKSQVNVQVNEFGNGAYGNLMEKLLKGTL
jgi:hypothetical protein